MIVTRWNVEDGAPFNGELRAFFGGAWRGVVTDDDADVVVEGNRSGAGFGHAVVTADLDGDRVLDLIVSEEESGTLYGLHGRREWRKRGTVQDHGAALLHRAGRDLGAGTLAVWNVEGNGPVVAMTSWASAAERSGVAA